MTLVTVVNFILGVMTIAVQVFILAVLGIYFFFPSWGKRLRQIFSLYFLPTAFLVALTATLGSLTYSNVIGYDPCLLCWWQRIFMYPLVVILGVALYRRGDVVKFFALPLAIIGAGIAIWHYLGQVGIVNLGSCAAVGYSVNCAARFVMEFGYITIPLMAFSTFILIIVLLSLLKVEDKRK